MSYAKEYYSTLAKLPDYGDFDIVAHFDLITKHSDNVKFFDESSKDYHNLSVEVAEVLSKKIPFFEVNTGAISRGWLDDAYPSAEFRAILRSRGVRFVLSSDAHSADALDCAFDRFAAAEEYVDSAAFANH